MADTKYQGWTNYPTWNVKLWIDNDEGNHIYFGEIAKAVAEETKPKSEHWTIEESRRFRLADMLKAEIGSPELDGMPGDLVGWALEQVNWHEIAASMLEDLEN